jgi:hypothetical protein
VSITDKSIMDLASEMIEHSDLLIKVANELATLARVLTILEGESEYELPTSILDKIYQAIENSYPPVNVPYVNTDVGTSFSEPISTTYNKDNLPFFYGTNNSIQI